MFISMLGYDGLTTVSAISSLLSNGWWCSKVVVVVVGGLMDESLESDIPAPMLLLLILWAVVGPIRLDCWPLTSAPASSPSFRVKIRVNPHRSHYCSVVGWESAPPSFLSPGADSLSVTDPAVTNAAQNNIPWKWPEKKQEDPIRRFVDKRKRYPVQVIHV